LHDGPDNQFTDVRLCDEELAKTFSRNPQNTAPGQGARGNESLSLIQEIEFATELSGLKRDEVFLSCDRIRPECLYPAFENDVEISTTLALAV